MKHLDYKIMKVLLVHCIIFLLIAISFTMYMLLPALGNPYILRISFQYIVIMWVLFIIMLIIRSIIMKKIEKYEEWLSVVVKENYIDSVCTKYNIKKNAVMPLHYATTYLQYNSNILWTTWLNERVSIFIFTDNQLYVYEEVFNPAKGIVESKTSNYYYYSDITNFKLEERSGEIGVKFTAGNTTFDEYFGCEDGDGTYDSIMFLQDSIRKHHENK